MKGKQNLDIQIEKISEAFEFFFLCINVERICGHYAFHLTGIFCMSVIQSYPLDIYIYLK